MLNIWKDVAELSRSMEEMRKEIKASTALKDTDRPAILDRLADLEVKVSKLWMLLTDITPKGDTKLSKFGRRFGGMAKLNSR